MVVGIVMTSLTSFFVAALSGVSQQSVKQAAIQVADEGTELVRAVSAASVLTGRDRTSSDTQWNNPVTGVSGYLADMVEAYDTSASTGSGASAALPTAAQTTAVSGVTYSRYFYVGRCWQPVGGGACGATHTSGYVGYLRVLVAVNWTCPRAGTCSYVTATLVNDATDPLFNSNDVAQAPGVNNPGAQLSERTIAITGLELTATGGAPPLVWSASGLPAGLTMTSSGMVSGTPTTAGTYSVVVSVTDARAKTGTATVPWTVNPLPTPAKPANQTGEVGIAASALQVVASGGTGGYTWAATGLPDGLTIGAGTGIIAGTPTTAGTSTVTVTVTDSVGGTGTTTFTWTVAAVPAITLPVTAQTSTQGSSITPIQATVSGGVSPFTWSAAHLPTGLSMNSSGVISGTPSAGTRFLTTITVTDGLGVTASVTIVWNVSSSSALRVTAPVADRTDTVGTSVSVNVSASGGTGTKTWTVSGLPTGTSYSSSTSKITGTPTTAGTWTVTLVVTDGSSNRATVMFTWTVR